MRCSERLRLARPVRQVAAAFPPATQPARLSLCADKLKHHRKGTGDMKGAQPSHCAFPESLFPEESISVILPKSLKK